MPRAPARRPGCPGGDDRRHGALQTPNPNCQIEGAWPDPTAALPVAESLPPGAARRTRAGWTCPAPVGAPSSCPRHPSGLDAEWRTSAQAGEGRPGRWRERPHRVSPAHTPLPTAAETRRASAQASGSARVGVHLRLLVNGVENAPASAAPRRPDTMAIRQERESRGGLPTPASPPAARVTVRPDTGSGLRMRTAAAQHLRRERTRGAGTGAGDEGEHCARTMPAVRRPDRTPAPVARFGPSSRCIGQDRGGPEPPSRRDGAPHVAWRWCGSALRARRRSRVDPPPEVEPEPRGEGVRVRDGGRRPGRRASLIRSGRPHETRRPRHR